MDVLQLDVSGRPQSWISAKEAAVIYASDGVAWTLGEAFFVLRGGLQRRTGLQSRIEVHPIIAVRGAVPSRAWRQTPALTNGKLFARDQLICSTESYSSIPIRIALGQRGAATTASPNRAIRASTQGEAQGPRISNHPGAPCGRPQQCRKYRGSGRFEKALS